MVFSCSLQKYTISNNYTNKKLTFLWFFTNKHCLKTQGHRNSHAYGTGLSSLLLARIERSAAYVESFLFHQPTPALLYHRHDDLLLRGVTEGEQQEGLREMQGRVTLGIGESYFGNTSMRFLLLAD